MVTFFVCMTTYTTANFWCSRLLWSKSFTTQKENSNVNTTPELRIFILIGFLQFFRRFPQINVGGDSAHLSSFGKRTHEPRPRSPVKGTLRQRRYEFHPTLL